MSKSLVVTNRDLTLHSFATRDVCLPHAVQNQYRSTSSFHAELLLLLFFFFFQVALCTGARNESESFMKAHNPEAHLKCQLVFM